MSKRHSRRHPAATVVVSDGSSRERSALAWVSAASIGLFVALAWPVIDGKTYAGDDLDHFHLPLRHFYWQCLQNGDSFDWLPNIFCGFYLTGEGQIGTYHPWHWLLYRWLPFEVAFNLEVFASYPFLFAGMTGFLRRTGRSWPAALFGAMTFTFSGFCLLHFMHINGIAIVAHIPWLLWAIDVAARDNRPRRRLLAWTAISLLTASQILLGYPQYVWMSFLAEVFWACLVSSGRGRIGLLARLAATLLVGALLGAVQLLPTYDHLANSDRTALGGSVAHFLPLNPLNVIQLVAPYLLPYRVYGGNTHESGLYVGAIPLMLLAWLFARRSELGPERKLTLAMAAFGGVALLLAFGQYGLIYYLQTWLPIVGNFRVPARYIVLVHFAVTILAAIAFDKWTRAEKSSAGNDRMIWRLTGSSLFVFLVVWLVLPVLTLLFSKEFFFWPLPRSFKELSGPVLVAMIVGLVGPFLISIAAMIVTKARGERWGVTALVLFAAVDLGCYGFTYVIYPRAQTWESMLAAAPPMAPDASRLVTALPRPGQLVFMGNQNILRGARLMDGYAGLLPANRLNYRTVAALRVANAGFVLRSEQLDLDPVPGLQPLKDNDAVFRVPDPLPRFRFVTRAVASHAPAEDLLRIPIESTALVEAPVELDAGSPGTVQLQSERPGALDLRVETPGRQLLVIADRFHAGWQAEVDRQPQPVWRVNGDFMGVAVEPGEHAVRLVFQPLSLAYGRMVSALGAALLASCLLIGSILTRRGRQA